MKFGIALLAFATAAVAIPAASNDLVGNNLETRSSDDPLQVTDELLFDLYLPQFIIRRDDKDPPNLDWSSDNCTSLPDNPFGWPFLDACFRHDFGYRNYKEQARFTRKNRKILDKLFLEDLRFQCQTDKVRAKLACRALARLYYWAVRLFGSEGEIKRNFDPEAQREYERAKKDFEEAVKKDREAGLLP